MEMTDRLRFLQVGLRNDAVLVAVESPAEPVTVTFKDAMLRAHIYEFEDSEVVMDLLLSYVDDNGHDFENLVFTVNGEWELRQADYTSTLFDVSSPRKCMVRIS